MDAINAFIMRRQSGHKRSFSNVMRRPWQSASKPQAGLVNKHDKGVVRAL
jgi:hypothetical protein